MAHVPGHRPSIRSIAAGCPLQFHSPETELARRELSGDLVPIVWAGLETVSNLPVAVWCSRLTPGCKMSLTDGLSRSRIRNPEKAAIVFGHQSWSYAQFDQLTDDIARNLIAAGLEPGD